MVVVVTLRDRSPSCSAHGVDNVAVAGSVACSGIGVAACLNPGVLFQLADHGIRVVFDDVGHCSDDHRLPGDTRQFTGGMVTREFPAQIVSQRLDALESGPQSQEGRGMSIQTTVQGRHG